jgi:hypothetical protein
MMEVIYSSETLVLTRPTERNVPEDAFFIVTAMKTSKFTRDNPLQIEPRKSSAHTMQKGRYRPWF